MAEGINVRFAGELQRFIQNRVNGEAGLYSSASEYIRDLVRRDYEHEEQRKWHALRQELKAGVEADESAFIPLNADDVIAQARSRRKSSVNAR
ncbi:putative addiction module antidote protein, CC2985 family [Opitutaceae bacterium TAV1]|nr:addiction module antitoxin [Opitutaceae bacterium TAV5]EIQ01723.1 putative addiction module antidote protein, CC2985 family [Opitutaceae bacterium TAV1]